MFFIERHRKIRWFPRRRAETRKARKIRVIRESRAEARKARKRRAFRTPKDTFWRAFANVFMEKTSFSVFLHNKTPIFYAASEAKSVPKVISGTPKARILRAFRTFLCLPRRIVKSPVFYGEFTAFLGRKTTFFPFPTFKVGLMFRSKSHLWPTCTLFRLQESFKKLVKYVRGRGGEAPGGAPHGRCPKCRTVAHRLHFGAHFGKWFLLTFVDSSAKTEKMRSPKGVKRENPVKYGTFAKDGFSTKTRYSRKPRRGSKDA